MDFADGKTRDLARDEARNKARQVLRDYQITKPPVWIEPIAEAHGAQIARHRFEGPETRRGGGTIERRQAAGHGVAFRGE